MNVTIQFKRKAITGTVRLHAKDDSEWVRYKGSVCFPGTNYTGKLRHDGKIHMFYNGRDYGIYACTSQNLSVWTTTE